MARPESTRGDHEPEESQGRRVREPGHLEKDRTLDQAFHALTPGRQRAYVLHFTGAKQSKTRTTRIEKCAPDILAGRGRNDR